MAHFGDEGALSRAYVHLSDTSISGYDVVDAMDFLVQSSTSHTRAVAAGVLLLDSRDLPHVIASSSERTEDLEEAQLGSGAGPCLDSIRAGEPLEVPSISAQAAQWPAFAAAAAADGYLASYAVPMRLRGSTIGGLNLFFVERGEICAKDILVASTLAQLATIGVLHYRQLVSQLERADQLQGALDSRVVIEQAKGVIAQQRAIQVGEAFVLLRSHARDNGLRLRDTAEQIVGRTLVL
jgi:hypothetical protein